MTTRSRTPLAGFGWLKRAINLGHGNARAVFGGAALLLVANFLPSLVTLPLQLGAAEAGGPPDMTRFAGIMLFSMACGLFLVPLFAGYLRVIHATERREPVRAFDVFAPYREGQTLRLVGYGLAMLAVYIASFVVVIALAGGGIASWYMQVITAQGGNPPPIPSGLGLAFVLVGVVGLLMLGVYAISLGQVAIGGRSVLGAVGDGLVGAAKNVLPLLVFAVCAVLAVLVAGLGIGVVVLVMTLLAKFVGAWLMFVVIVPVYIALMLAMLAVMFGVMYHLWRDVCGDDTTPASEGPVLAA